MTEISNVGGTPARARVLFLDDARQQYRSILSFNTAVLPDDASISAVTLKIMRSSLAGTDPFTTHGNILADVRTGGSADAALQPWTSRRSQQAGHHHQNTCERVYPGRWRPRAL
jgi:hypothetical protein